METADLCGLQMNVLVYDPKMSRFREFYTSVEMRLEAIYSVCDDQPDASEPMANFRNLKFKSIDARIDYQDDVEYEVGFPFQRTLDQLARMKEELLSLERKRLLEMAKVPKSLKNVCQAQLLDLSRLAHVPDVFNSPDDFESVSSQFSMLR